MTPAFEERKIHCEVDLQGNRKQSSNLSPQSRLLGEI